MKQLFSKKDILTIPNGLSFLRIVMIPFMVRFYLKDEILKTIILIALSAITDIADGKIARKFNMVSDFGKILDPIADKMTQLALAYCLIKKNKWMLLLLILMAVKELILGFYGYLTIQISDEVNSSKWFGKACTAMIYGVMLLLILIPGIKTAIANIMIFACCGMVVFSAAMYTKFYMTVYMDHIRSEAGRSALKKSAKLVVACIWAGVIILCLIFGKHISVDKIVTITSGSLAVSVLILWGLFALKSITAIMYSGIIYAASGIIFPLKIALPVNIVETAIMISIPFFLGRALGEDGVSMLADKYPKLAPVIHLRAGNDFFYSFIIRLIGFLPSDPLSAYMGASGTVYIFYLLGSVLGMLPTILVLTVLGINARNPESPEFWIMLAVQLVLSIISILCFLIVKRKSDKISKINTHVGHVC